MNPKKWFSVGVRLIGVWTLTSGAQEVIMFVNAKMGYLKTYDTNLYMIHAIGDFLIGLYLVSGALVSLTGGWGANDESPDDPIQNDAPKPGESSI